MYIAIRFFLRFLQAGVRIEVSVDTKRISVPFNTYCICQICSKKDSIGRDSGTWTNFFLIETVKGNSLVVLLEIRVLYTTNLSLKKLVSISLGICRRPRKVRGLEVYRVDFSKAEGHKVGDGHGLDIDVRIQQAVTSCRNVGMIKSRLATKD